MKNIVTATPLAGHRLDVLFDDGLKAVIDIAPFIRNGVSSALKNEEYFRQVKVTDGFITWPNGFDFCPETLYQYAMKGEAALA